MGAPVDRINLLVNLPAGFFSRPELVPTFARLSELAELHCASCNTADEILPYLQWADAVLMWSWPVLTAELLDRCPRLRFSANLDVSQEGARILLARGIPVSVSRRAFSPAVAEMALTLILACLRRTSTYHAAMRQGAETWVRGFPDDVDANERQLAGRRVGILGFGAVGRRLAELLAPFRCDVGVVDPYLPDEVVRQCGVARATLDDLVGRSEVLVLCAATNPGSRGLLTASHVAALPEGAVLVNVGRAALVDGEALLARLKRGDLYAALDVFDEEPLPLDSELRALPNVYLTPHRAGGIMESVERLLSYLADDLAAFLGGAERQHALTQAMVPMLDG